MASKSNRSGSRKTSSRIQFVTTPTVDTPGTALLLHFDDKRYLIGSAHEGLQRAGLQFGARFFKAREFFLTGKTEWSSTGGLMGMILTLADSTKASAQSKAEIARSKLDRQAAKEEEARLNPKKTKNKGRQTQSEAPSTSAPLQVTEEDTTVTLHGGPNLTHTVATARSFIFRHGTPIKVIEHHNEDSSPGEDRDWAPTWKDELIQVWSMAISPTRQETMTTSKAPRKRSLDEFIISQGHPSAQSREHGLSQRSEIMDEEERNQQTREFVVSEMFNSTWKFDNLVETPLHQVKLPASIFVRDSGSKKIVKYKGPVPDGTRPIPNINVLVRQPWPAALIDKLPATEPSDIAMSYIVRNHKQRGKFKPKVAMELKVPPGPLFNDLARGIAVQSSEGKTITPDMVLEPEKDGSGVAVIDLPSKEHIPELIKRPEWKAKNVMAGVGAIVWILGRGVIHDTALRTFIDSKPDLKHIISSVEYCPNYLVQTSAAAAAIRHHQIDPMRFPVPVHSNAIPQPESKVRNEAEPKLPHVLQAERGLRIDLEPSFKIVENDVIPHLNTALVVQETPHDVIKLGQAAQQATKTRLAQEEIAKQDLPSADAEIIPLGTGSASPSLFRNVSATLLRVPGQGSYLIDCGENTLGQLKRVFTEPELAEVLRDLKLIWISHLHPDHHLGTTSVIRAWCEEVHGKDAGKRRRSSLTETFLNPAKILAEERRLFVVGHRHMMRWLEEYSSVEDFGYDQLVLLASSSGPKRSHPLTWNGINVDLKTASDPKIRSAMHKATGLSNLVTVPVSHCYGAQAVSLTFPNGFKFSYSGDCRPSKEFANIGKGSTVLLHEATFDDDLSGDAEAKKHSTTSEAIAVATAMGARRLILTHFSQRYAKIPSTASMKSLNVKFEDAKETDDAMEAMEPPESGEDKPPTERSNAGEEMAAMEPPENGGDEHLDPEQEKMQSETLKPPPAHDMKIGVAFDYMRVKVKDIIHLEKFTPALRELYKEEEKEEHDAKAKKAAKEAFSDEVRDVGKNSATVNAGMK